MSTPWISLKKAVLLETASAPTPRQQYQSSCDCLHKSKLVNILVEIHTSNWVLMGDSVSWRKGVGGPWYVNHAPVGGLTIMHIWVSQIKLNWLCRGGARSWGRVKMVVRVVKRRSVKDQNILHACMIFLKMKNTVINLIEC